MIVTKSNTEDKMMYINHRMIYLYYLVVLFSKWNKVTSISFPLTKEDYLMFKFDVPVDKGGVLDVMAFGRSVATATAPSVGINRMPPKKRT